MYETMTVCVLDGDGNRVVASRALVVWVAVNLTGVGVCWGLWMGVFACVHVGEGVFMDVTLCVCVCSCWCVHGCNSVCVCVCVFMLVCSWM